jgi:hypothetical protein
LSEAEKLQGSAARAGLSASPSIALAVGYSPFNRNFGFFDTMCRDNTDAFAFKPDWIVRFLGHKFQKMSPESGYLFSERTADHHIDEVFRQLPELLDLSFKRGNTDRAVV